MGLNENRGETLISPDHKQLSDRMAHYLDPDISFSDLDHRIRSLTQNWAGFAPQKVRDKLLLESPYDPSKVVRFCVKPFDVRWAYIDTTTSLWNRSRPGLVQAANLGSDFLVFRRRAPRAHDGTTLLFSRCLIDQHVMHKDAYVLPFYLAPQGKGGKAAKEASGTIELFGDPEPKSSWLPNLSQLALDYLTEVGVTDVQTSQSNAQLLWQHVLAIGNSPLYLEENDDAIRSDWPRVPLPPTYDKLMASALLGRRLANILDIETKLTDIATTVSREAQSAIGRIARIDDKPLSPQGGDLEITVGWGTEQRREQRSGATSRIVMPASGNIDVRERTNTERQTLGDKEINLLGTEVVDVYLNRRVFWSGVPQAVWDFKIGGFQVLRKWLSYRDQKILGRSLTVDEVREFTEICQRLTELVLLSPLLDENYLAVTDPPL